MTEEDLEQLKKTQYGITLRSYESVGGLCSYFVYDLFTSNDDFFKEIEEIKSITLEDINQAYKNICEGLITYCVLEGD